MMRLLVLTMLSYAALSAIRSDVVHAQEAEPGISTSAAAPAPDGEENRMADRSARRLRNTGWVVFGSGWGLSGLGLALMVPPLLAEGDIFGSPFAMIAMGSAFIICGAVMVLTGLPLAIVGIHRRRTLAVSNRWSVQGG